MENCHDIICNSWSGLPLVEERERECKRDLIIKGFYSPVSSPPPPPTPPPPVSPPSSTHHSRTWPPNWCLRGEIQANVRRQQLNISWFSAKWLIGVSLVTWELHDTLSTSWIWFLLLITNDSWVVVMCQARPALVCCNARSDFRRFYLG